MTQSEREIQQAEAELGSRVHAVTRRASASPSHEPRWRSLRARSIR